MDNIGRRIKALRIEKGMTLEDLGDKIGVGKSTIRKWEEGEIKDIKASRLTQIADALGTTPSELMGYQQAILDSDYQNTLLYFCTKLNALGKEKLLERAEELALIDKYLK